MTSLVPMTGGTGLISREDLAKSLNNAAMTMPTVGGDKSFLKMDKRNGDWIFGQEEIVVEPASLWALDPTSFKHGWVAWDTEGGGAPVQEIMVSINRSLPALDSMPKLGMSTPDKKGNSHQLEYQQQRSVDFTCISGEDEGVTVEYKQSSTGAMKLFGKLTNGLLAQIEKGDDLVAIGSLSHEEYDHKKYGPTLNPLFNIKEWRKMSDTSAPPVEEPKKEEPVPTGRVRTRPAAAPVQQAPVEEPADDKDADEAAAAEYAAAQEQAPAEQAPHRRMRR